ncbi:MAG: ATP-dependent Clp protease adaptor ClpS [Anaerolineales bacterium]
MAAGDLRTDSDTDTQQDTEQQVEWIVDESSDGGSWSIFVHNDDVTPWDFVVAVLQSVFQLSLLKAESITSRAHFTGAAHVVTLGKEEAKHRVGQAHGMARAAGYPLTFTIEPE